MVTDQGRKGCHLGNLCFASVVILDSHRWVITMAKYLRLLAIQTGKT